MINKINRFKKVACFIISEKGEIYQGARLKRSIKKSKEVKKAQYCYNANIGKELEIKYS